MQTHTHTQSASILVCLCVLHCFERNLFCNECTLPLCPEGGCNLEPRPLVHCNASTLHQSTFRGGEGPGHASHYSHLTCLRGCFRNKENCRTMKRGEICLDTGYSCSHLFGDLESSNCQGPLGPSGSYGIIGSLGYLRCSCPLHSQVETSKPLFQGS